MLRNHLSFAKSRTHVDNFRKRIVYGVLETPFIYFAIRRVVGPNDAKAQVVSIVLSLVFALILVPAVMFIGHLMFSVLILAPAHATHAYLVGTVEEAIEAMGLKPPETTTTQRRPARPPIELVEDEITWVENGYHGWFGTRPRPQCTAHPPFELMARSRDRYAYGTTGDRITSISHGDRDHTAWVPYCTEGKHDVAVPGGVLFYQAEELAQNRIEGRARALNRE